MTKAVSVKEACVSMRLTGSAIRRGYLLAVLMCVIRNPRARWTGLGCSVFQKIILKGESVGELSYFCQLIFRVTGDTLKIKHFPDSQAQEVTTETRKTNHHVPRSN